MEYSIGAGASSRAGGRSSMPGSHEAGTASLELVVVKQGSGSTLLAALREKYGDEPTFTYVPTRRVMNRHGTSAAVERPGRVDHA